MKKTAAPHRKIRLDDLLVHRSLAPDLETARRLIMAGEVLGESRVLDKAGEKVPEDLPLRLRTAPCAYVSWGGVKLAGALDQFCISPSGKRCLDIGASTGGFTQVLLQRGASSVTALDVAYGILDFRLRQDPRVKVIERTNFRVVPDDFFSEPFDLITADVSFISLKRIMPKASLFLSSIGDILVLIKPQFEADQDQIEPGGIVRDIQIHRNIVADLRTEFASCSLYLQGLHAITRSHPQKNQEYLSWWRRTPPSAEPVFPVTE